MELHLRVGRAAPPACHCWRDVAALDLGRTGADLGVQGGGGERERGGGGRHWVGVGAVAGHGAARGARVEEIRWGPPGSLRTQG